MGAYPEKFAPWEGLGLGVPLVYPQKDWYCTVYCNRTANARGAWGRGGWRVLRCLACGAWPAVPGLRCAARFLRCAARFLRCAAVCCAFPAVCCAFPAWPTIFFGGRGHGKQCHWVLPFAGVCILPPRFRQILGYIFGALPQPARAPDRASEPPSRLRIAKRDKRALESWPREALAGEHSYSGPTRLGDISRLPEGGGC